MAISTLGIFNGLVPKDDGSRLVARDLAYGRANRQRLDIYAPSMGNGPWPVVTFLYGGAWSDGDKGNYAFAARALAALGYVVAVPDYRLVPEVEYPLFLEDCALAVDWVVRSVAEFGGDTQRLALAGHSAGAYNAVMLALDHRYRGQCASLGRLRCVVGLSGPYDFFPFDGPISLRVFGAVAEPRLTQPIAHVEQGAPPMLLVTGGRDALVLPRNVMALASRLHAAGSAAEQLTFAHLAHAGPLVALARPARFIAPVLAEIEAFLARHMMPAPACSPAAIG